MAADGGAGAVAGAAGAAARGEEAGEGERRRPAPEKGREAAGATARDGGSGSRRAPLPIRSHGGLASERRTRYRQPRRLHGAAHLLGATPAEDAEESGRGGRLASQPDSWGCPPCPARPWAGPTREEAVLLQLPTQPDAAEHQQLQAAQHQQLQAPQRPGVVACADGSTGRGLGGERENGQGRFELRPAGCHISETGRLYCLGTVFERFYIIEGYTFLVLWLRDFKKISMLS
uniref:Uncharacterized protein n=1 Tax=Oryza rufipogon TaxID=4529 RepID=A0A0E0PZM1_ORYRU